MAVIASGSHLSLRILLISASVLSAALLLHFWLPTIAEFVTAELPSLYGAVSTWLRPPYLYLLVNCIILCIVASSKFQHGRSAGQSPLPTQKAVAAAVPVKFTLKEVDDPLAYAGYENGYFYGVVEDSVVMNAVEEDEKAVVVEEEEEASVEVAAVVDVTDVAVPDATVELERSDSVEFAVMEEPQEKEKDAENKKPPFSTRFGHRRSAKSSPEVGKALRVTRSRRHDTLESTWRTITDGRAMPLTRHLKKSDTWETHMRRGVGIDENSSPPPPPWMKKSQTFNDNTTTSHNTEAEEAGDTGKLRREPSLGQEELNRRVEAFIRKFNEDMRLQREESLNQFQEMINRGTG